MTVDAVITAAVGGAVFDLLDLMLPFCFHVLQGCIVFVLHFKYSLLILMNECGCFDNSYCWLGSRYLCLDVGCLTC